MEQAEAEAIDRFVTADLTTVTLPDGTTVTVIAPSVTRSIDADALAALIPATVLDKVTKRTIDLGAFDAAVSCGLIDPAVVAQVTAKTEKKRSLRITDHR